MTVKFKDYYNYKKIIVFPGRFQPFHIGHYQVYKYLEEMFGDKDLYIATSDIHGELDRPFSFKEKQKIISVMFKIPDSKIVEVKNPYVAKEITSRYKQNSPLIYALGNKDQDRLKGDFYKEYDEDKELKGYTEEAYYIIVPTSISEYEYDGSPLSGSRIRETFRTGTEEQKLDMFKNMFNCFGDINENIFKLIDEKINLPYEK